MLFSFALPLTRPLRDVGDGSDGGVDVGFGIEGADGEAHAAVGRLDTELAMDQRGAMQSGTRGDVVIYVEHYSDIAGIDTSEVHENRRKMIFETVATVETYSFDLSQALDEFFCECHLLPMDVLHATLIEPILARRQ